MSSRLAGPFISRLQLLSKVLMVLITAIVISACSPSPYDCETMPDQYRDLQETTNHVFILWRSADETMESFETRLFSDITPTLATYSPAQLKVLITEADIESLTLIKKPRPDGSEVAAVISIGITDEQEAADIAELLQPMASFVAGYRVSTAIPLDYDRDWDDGEPTPGMQQVTFLQKRKDLTDQEFKDYWFCSHTPFALDIHPLWRYERNVVEAAITDDAPEFDGIVGLHVQNVEDLTIPDNFFGGNFVVNGLRTFSDILNFLETIKLQVTAMQEVILISEE